MRAIKEGRSTSRPSPEILGLIEERRLADEKRRELFGEVRPIITTEHAGHRVVAVGNTIHFDKGWKTFQDFLQAYVKRTLGAEWIDADLAKPFEERHPILQWYAAVALLKQRDKERAEPDERGVYSSRPDGPTRAYLLLAYDLYILKDHLVLQESLVKRLKDQNHFQGARYELFVAATMIRAGCKIQFEDESDTSRKHPEFVATHIPSGQLISVEAKSRHRPGVLGFKGRKSVGGLLWRIRLYRFRVGLTGLLKAALDKDPEHPYLIFIDANMPPEVASPLSAVNWTQEISNSIRTVDLGVTEGGLYVGSGFNMLVVTNTPDHYGELGGTAPPYVYFCSRPSPTARTLNDTEVLDAIELSLKQAGRIPTEFPGD